MNGTRPFQDNEIDLILNSLSSARDKLFFLLGIKTGFRCSEILSIKVKDCLEFDESIKSSITVSKSKMKGKLASRTIPLSKGIQSVLREYIETLPKSQEYLFMSRKGGKLSRIQAWRILRQAVLTNKLKGKVATHSLRKTYARKVYSASDKNLLITQRAMGHSNINNTVSYLSTMDDEVNELILKAQEN